METRIQLMEGMKYPVLVTFPFLYEKPKGGELYIDRVAYLIDHIKDMIDTDGNILRLIRVYKRSIT